MNTMTGMRLSEMVYDRLFCCIILVFFSNNFNVKFFRVECVEEKHVQEIIEQHHSGEDGFVELSLCRSSPIFIKDEERIRISLRGCIRLPTEYKKDQMIISFLRNGFHKHIVFPVETNFGNRPTHVGYLDFNKACGGKNFIYQASFDADFPITKKKRAKSAAPQLTSLKSGSYSRSKREANLETTSLTSVESASTNSTRSARASSPEGHPHTKANIWIEINNFLSAKLINYSWKCILRAIMNDSVGDADSIISEAEKNNAGNVREIIYKALKTWIDRTKLTTSKQMFDAIIHGLRKEQQEQVATSLIEEYEHKFFT